MYALTPDEAAADGVEDDTDALRTLLAEMQARNLPGFLNGKYRVRAGELSWMHTAKSKYAPGPVLYTMPGTTLIAAGDKDAPILTIGASRPGSYVQGGCIENLDFRDAQPGAASQRHGICMWGVEKMTFGNLYGDGLAGDLVHVADKTEGDLNGDWTHVFDCEFRSIEAVRSRGWALNNDAPNQTMNACAFGVIRSILCDKGAWRHSGAGSSARVVVVGGSLGWGVDFQGNRGGTTRTDIQMMELDGPEYGVRVSGNMQVDLGKVRFNHRYREFVTQGDAPHAWPRTCLQVGSTPYMGSTFGLEADIVHRVGPHRNMIPQEAVSTLVDFADDYTVRDVVIKQRILDTHEPRLKFEEYVRLNPRARATLNDRRLP